MITAVAHTGITVRDLDASLSFWCGALDATLLRRFELPGSFAADVVGVAGAHITAATVTLGGHTLELLQYLGPDQRDAFAPRPCDLGSWHLALDVSDLDAVVSICAQHGWQPAGPARTMESGPRSGTRFVYLHDPDGATLELIDSSR